MLDSSAWGREEHRVLETGYVLTDKRQTSVLFHSVSTSAEYFFKKSIVNGIEVRAPYEVSRVVCIVFLVIIERNQMLDEKNPAT